MVGNIGILIHAIHQGTQLMVTATWRRHSRNRVKTQRYQRRKAVYLVVSKSVKYLISVKLLLKT